jgi:hypothetical protein
MSHPGMLCLTFGSLTLRPRTGLGRIVCFGFALWATVAFGDGTPATVDEAAKVLDLRTIDLFDGAEAPGNRTVAHLFYQAKTSVEKAHRFHEDALKMAGWQVLADGYVSEQMAAGTYGRNGFKVSLSVMSGSDPGTVTITMTNHGNVDTSKLPAPDNSKPFYATPVSHAYLTTATTEAAAAALREKLTTSGWEPYGDAGDVTNYKQHAVLLHVRVATAPAQANQTFVDFSTELMSADLPAPPDALRVQYAESNRQLSFDAKGSLDEVVSHYRKRLGLGDWKATTENMIESDFEQFLVFRNPGKDMLTLKLRSVDGITRGSLQFLSADDVQKLEAELAASKPKGADPDMAEEDPVAAEMEVPETPNLIVEVPLAGSAKVTDASDTALEITLASGSGKSAAEALRKHFLGAGWAEETAVLEKVAGNVTVTKEGCMLAIVYSDIGIESAEMTVMSVGGKLVPKKVEVKASATKKSVAKRPAAKQPVSNKPAAKKK